MLISVFLLAYSGANLHTEVTTELLKVCTPTCVNDLPGYPRGAFLLSSVL